MKGLKGSVAAVLSRTGIIPVMAALRNTRGSTVRVLAYHRILPRTDEDAFPSDLELVSAWSEEFEWQMRHVASRYDVMAARDLVDCLDSGRSVPRRALVVTFDDGFVDNHAHAFPVLRGLSLPATLFVSTAYVDSGRRFWFEAIASMVCNTRRDRCAPPTMPEPLSIGRQMGERRRAITALLRHAKSLCNADRLAFVDALSVELAVDPDSLPEPEHRPLDWARVREMAAGGVEIGSHTVSHPVLSRLADAEDVRRELVESKAAIEREVGQRVLTFAYPVGGVRATNDAIVAASREAGYRLAFTYRPGVTTLGPDERFTLKRLPVERYIDREMFAAMLAVPEVFVDGPNRHRAAGRDRDRD